MGAKVVTLTVKDQNLLRVALDESYRYRLSLADAQANPVVYRIYMEEAQRIEELKERLV